MGEDRWRDLFLTEDQLMDEAYADGNRIDFEASVRGWLQLVPTGEAYSLLADDYEAMVRAGMLFNDQEPFENIMGRCSDIEARANNV